MTQYKVSTNLGMTNEPRAAVEQFFTDIEDVLSEVRDSLTRCPEMAIAITTEDER